MPQHRGYVARQQTGSLFLELHAVHAREAAHARGAAAHAKVSAAAAASARGLAPAAQRRAHVPALPARARVQSGPIERVSRTDSVAHMLFGPASTTCPWRQWVPQVIAEFGL